MQTGTYGTNQQESVIAIIKTNDFLQPFLSECVIKSMKLGIEGKPGSIAMTDKGFSSEEISYMRQCTLSDIEYLDVENPAEFKIKIGLHEIPFSNRQSSRNELRGAILRDRLNELKRTNSEMHLYDALIALEQDPKQMVQYIYPPFFSETIDNSLKANIIEGLNSLARACIKYAKENTLSDENAISTLQSILTNNPTIYKAALNGANQNTLFEILNSNQDIIKAQQWIDDVRSLVLKYPEHQEKLSALVQSAQNLIGCHTTTPQDHTKIQELTKTFKEHVNTVQQLHLGKTLSWKNIFNIFCFIPSIVNIIKTEGRDFWLKNNITEERPTILSASVSPSAEDKPPEKNPQLTL